jgi:hypothetical protein
MVTDIREIVEKCQISKTSVRKNLSKDLNMSRVRALVRHGTCILYREWRRYVTKIFFNISSPFAVRIVTYRSANGNDM